MRAILFDLDDTLLSNSMDSFIPAYFRALTDSVADLVPAERLVSELMRATRAMDEGRGADLSNEEAFAAVFYPALGRPRDELEPLLERFYAEGFPSLRGLTRSIPEAREAVEWAFEAGFQVVIATNPLFPRSAIEQRLEWAGLPPSDYPFELITCYENMHATKSRPAYYLEIATTIGREPSECLMVGDNWRWDVVHAIATGMAAFWISDPAEPLPDPALPLAGRGSLADFLVFARSELSRHAT